MLFEQWWFYVILYLIFAVLFNQFYKVAIRKMQKAGALTVIAEGLAGIFALLLIPLFKIRFPK